MSCNDWWYSVDQPELDDPYDGLTLADVLTDREKAERREKIEREHFWCSPSTQSLDISYRD
jgi:hypothetical protein